MCGIAGLIYKSRKAPESTLNKMLKSIEHRGPDGRGVLCNGNIAIGMQRLSIIDLPGGDQPIYNEDKTVAIIFNGEIYNYKELRKELTRKGHKFRTNSDTETILHQYEESGTDTAKKLNGMFAFAIYDIKYNRIVISRDHMGIKPLAYYFDNEMFLFGSEIKAIIASGQIPQEINGNSLSDFLTFRYVPGPESIWKGISKLPPGHTLTLDLAKWKFKTEQYWEIIYPDLDSEIVSDSKTYLKQFTSLFEDSVERQLQADVPVGILLSGGLDSSAVAYATTKINRKKTMSFSVGFAGLDDFNELKYSRIMAKHLGIENHEIEIGDREFVDFLPKFVYQTDEPLADLASIPLNFVSALAREKVKVVLSGEGSDELLAGYNFDVMQRRLLAIKSLDSLPIVGKVFNSRYYSYPIRNLPYMTDIFPIEMKTKLLRKDDIHDRTRNLVKKYYSKFPKADPINQILYAYCQSWLVEDLLMKADRMTMANSLELRVPFLDYRIVEWAAKLPVNLKTGSDANKLSTKIILRRYAAQAKLPEEIINRPKKGFPVPAYLWLSTKLKGYAIDTITKDSYICKHLNSDHVLNILHSGIKPDALPIQQHRLWQLIILELWMKQWK